MPPGRPARGLAILQAAAAAALLAAPGPAAGQAGVWLSHGPPGGNVYCLVADPARPSRLYVGTSLGVFRSQDAGASWARPAGGVPPGRVQAIAIDPTAPDVLYAGTVTPNGVPSLGVYKSADGGVLARESRARLDRDGPRTDRRDAPRRDVRRRCGRAHARGPARRHWPASRHSWNAPFRPLALIA